VKSLIEFIKGTFLGGLLVILPIGLVTAIVMKILDMIKEVLSPFVDLLPDQLQFPGVIASVLLLAACFVTGLIVKTRAGRGASSLLERLILNHIPGYSMVRSFVRRLGNIEESNLFAPALVEIEDALVPAFVVEENLDGRYTVFVPAAPNPASGAVYIMDKTRVHLLDISVLKTAKCVSEWGVGSEELLKAMRTTEVVSKTPQKLGHE
jgi:uncharacterized membrane protein